MAQDHAPLAPHGGKGSTRVTLAVALFRPVDEAHRSAALLQAMGYRSVLAPVAQIVATGLSPSEGEFDAIIATSARAFAFLSTEDRARLASTPLFAVGEATAASAKACGLAGKQTVAADAASLAPMFVPRWPGGARLLYLTARDRKGELEAAFAAAGFEVFAAEIYRAEALAGWSDEEAQAVAQCAAALHYSRRSAALAVDFAARAGCAEQFRALTHVCLSADVAEPLRAVGAATIALAREPSETGLFVALQAATKMA